MLALRVAASGLQWRDRAGIITCFPNLAGNGLSQTGGQSTSTSRACQRAFRVRRARWLQCSNSSTATMSLPQTSIERSFTTLLERARRDASVWLEFQASLSEFLGNLGETNETRNLEMASRRHAEWFLLERAGDVLGVAPVAAWGTDTEDLLSSEQESGHEALLGSFASVFEITGVNAGEGVWVRDLAGLGEYPLEEPDASRALEAGDLLVGRLFPVGDELYRISHASGFFRDPRLLSAVRRDLELARAERRGVVRLAQRELEAMFFSGPIAGTSAAGGKASASSALSARRSAVSAARRALAEGGLDDSEIDDVLAELASEPFDASAVLPGAGDRLGEILGRLAFETNVDLERARRALALAWPELSAPPEPEPRSKGKPVGSRSTQNRTPKVERALADFDARRSTGGDIEALFADLEQELQLDSEDTVDDEPAPDFPGVVGAMVIEFLWDIERERGAAAARELAAIANFAAYAESHGVFENLGERELLLYACLWLPEHASSGADATRWFQALVEFSAWAESQHEVSLSTALETTRAALAQSLPRVCNANAVLRARFGALSAGGEMLGFEGGRSARTPRGEQRELSLPKDAAPFVEPGDFMRTQATAGTELRVVCVYPPELKRLGELS